MYLLIRVMTTILIVLLMVVSSFSGAAEMGGNGNGVSDITVGEIRVGVKIPDVEVESVVGLPVSLHPAEGECLFIQFLDGIDVDSRKITKEGVILGKRFRGKGLRLISIFQHAAEDDILSFGHNLQVKWPLVMDDAADTALSSKLGVEKVPFNMLVDSKGTILATQLSGEEGHEIVAKHLGISLDEVQPLDEIPFDWREKFYSVYRLEENEVLKRIAPPFIPERKEYYLNEEPGQAELVSRGPKLFVFHWDGTLQRWGMSFGGDRSPLEHVLTFPLQISRFEFEGPEEVLNIDVPGDWIVRTESTPKERIKALEDILQEELNQPVHFEKREVEREVTIARGQFEYKPMDQFESERRETDIFVFSDLDKVREGGGGSSGSLHEFLIKLGDRLNHRIIDKTESSNVEAGWRWKQRRPPGEEVNLEGYFEQIGRQTSLRFVKEKRKVAVWFVSMQLSQSSDARLRYPHVPWKGTKDFASYSAIGHPIIIISGI